MVFHYLYYKIYRATLVGSLKDIPRFAACAYFGALLGINLLVLNAFLAKIDIIPFLLHGKQRVAGFMIMLIMGSWFYFNSAKVNNIITTYSQESEGQRKRGNAIVWTYVLLTIASIFLVAWFRPGKL